MSNYDMREAICASSGLVVMRRKPLIVPIVWFVVGVALLVINAMVPATMEWMNLKSAIVLLGAVFVIASAVVAIYRVMGNDRAPYHTADGCFLQKKELKFAKERASYIRDLVNRGDFTTLHNLVEDGVSAVTVRLYTSPRSGFCAVQVFEYVDMELQPVSDLKIVQD